MKTFRKVLSLLVVACLLILSLAACKQEDPGYQVKVVDALGNPYTDGVVVQFLKDGASAGMQVVNKEGIAAKDLEDGDYTVQLSFTDTDTEYYYDDSDMTLTPSKKTLEVVLAKRPGKEATTLLCNDKEYKAFPVDAGCSYVDLEKGKRNYFLFTPSVAGDYEFSMPGSKAVVGYYGAPHFVQENHAGDEPVDGKFKITIKASMIGVGDTGTTILVLGVDTDNEEHATLSIQRIGEPTWDMSDEPWTTYKTTVKLQEYKLPAGATLKEFDLTAADYKLVLDDNGQYHLNSKTGPLVLMRLGKKSQYLDDFKTICEKSRVGKHFYDEDGKLLRKESYNECLLEYIEVMDEKEGVYPLTEDLKYIIQQRGDHYGWFDADGTQYLFKDQNGDKVPGINAKISWLFPCCYIE